MESEKPHFAYLQKTMRVERHQLLSDSGVFLSRQNPRGASGKDGQNSGMG